ncbi:uncharacterized protein LOC117926024 [Vitis riparia]|uniref:uncharacterized protein LOC117926024 n=1 Tax=Vitis riparia TaxID=96939 RepID=UPI00155A8412|nr:uncharacterized protein LOC117926024 [Vitis riparia]
MSTSSSTSSVIPVFNGEHYHIWVVKMRFYLRSQGLWNVVMSEADPPPLGANPTIAQMKAYEEEKLKKDKAITCLHSGLADHIFTKIMDLETPKQRVNGCCKPMRLLGKAFIDQKVVEKIMVSVPQKFEAKISTIEESCDL